MQTASFQNGYFTALCNCVGKESKLTFAGESFICNPEGKVVARAKEGEDEILYYDIDLEQVKNSHAKQLFFRDRRPELYKNWW
jgi:N-carbamoylputrescine amidase